VSSKKTTGLTPEQKRRRDIRNGVLLAHVIISWAVIIAVRFKWWTVFMHGEQVGEPFSGTHEHAFQTGYISMACVIAFFFTSYDIVTNGDIQWPPLLASAFALGCAAEVSYKLVSEQDVIYRNLITYQMARDAEKEREAVEKAVTAAVNSSSTAAVDSSVAAVSSATKSHADDLPRVKFGWGLLTALYGTFCMVLLSCYLTFFAPRAEEAT
jgi:hypothetical protein